MGEAEPDSLPLRSSENEEPSSVGRCEPLQERRSAGYGEVLRIALPLVLSTASHTLTLFVDRMFLSWHSQDAVAAATPGGITYFTVCCFFLGTAQYTNTIVAQHHGAGDRPACARAVWQGVFFSLASVPVMLALIPLGTAILRAGGHGHNVTELEVDYFSILMLGGAMLPLNGALSSFFSGRGKTRVVLWGDLAGNVANAILAYVLIFGAFGFPEMGIRGAGLATAVTGVIAPIYWTYLFLSSRFRKAYRPLGEFRWDSRLFAMLLRYGAPAGVQFFLDIASFTVFVLLVGRLGEASLAAANIVLSIEMLSFLPMVGMSTATATLVGEYMGKSDASTAETRVYTALKLALLYTGFLAVLYLLFPGPFIELFRTRGEHAAPFDEVKRIGVHLLRVVALYTVFDTVTIICSGGLKGSGDTRFTMWAQTITAWVVFVPPVYVMVEYLHLTVYAAWAWCLVYTLTTSTVFWLRFRSGRWKKIRMVGGG